MIIIIGGGIAGLAAAYELAGRTIPFVLVEASERLGGLIHTEHVDGFTIDAGPDSILIQKPAALQLCEELDLGSRLMSTTPPRTAFVLKRERLCPLPSSGVLGIPTALTALARYELLNYAARARIALEPLAPRRMRGDESVASFFRRRFGRATVDLIADPLLGGIHAGDVTKLSMASVFPRFIEAEGNPGGVIRNLPRRTAAPDGLFRALRGGMGELVTSIQQRLPADAVRLRAPAIRLHRSAGRWRVELAHDHLDAEAVIVAAPAFAAATLLAPLDRVAADSCAAVPYVSTASVALGWRRADIAHPLNGSGFVVARKYNDVRITACTWVSSKWANRAPHGHVLLRAFLGGTHDPGAIELSDADLVERAAHDIATVLGVSGAPVLTRVVRWRNAGAQHTVGHRARMAVLASRLRQLPGLFVAGSGYHAIGIPDCIAHGREVAAEAADYATMGPIATSHDPESITDR